MNGIRFGRMKQRKSYTALGKDAHCSPSTVSHLEENIGENTSVALLLRLSDALDMTLDELMDDYPEDALGPGDHPTAKYTAEVALNAVGRYCRSHNISLPQYARMAGIKSRQSARRVWSKRKLKPSNIFPLAQLEGITVKEFIHRYTTTTKGENI